MCTRILWSENPIARVALRPMVWVVSGRGGQRRALARGAPPRVLDPETNGLISAVIELLQPVDEPLPY